VRRQRRPEPRLRQRRDAAVAHRERLGLHGGEARFERTIAHCMVADVARMVPMRMRMLIMMRRVVRGRRLGLGKAHDGREHVRRGARHRARELRVPVVQKI